MPDADSARSVVLLGKGALAVRVARWFTEQPHFSLAAIVPVVPEPSWTASLSEWARKAGVALVDSGDFRDLDPSLPVDLALSVFYDRIIDAPFIARCGRILNIHNGPLPRYRGVSPINWALRNEERSHGVTLHEITPGIDDGPIVAQVTYSIYPQVDEVSGVYERALAFAWALFETTMPILDTIAARAQDHSLATYYSARENAQLGDRRLFTRAVSRDAGG